MAIRISSRLVVFMSDCSLLRSKDRGWQAETAPEASAELRQRQRTCGWVWAHPGREGRGPECETENTPWNKGTRGESVAGLSRETEIHKAVGRLFKGMRAVGGGSPYVMVLSLSLHCCSSLRILCFSPLMTCQQSTSLSTPPVPARPEERLFPLAPQPALNEHRGHRLIGLRVILSINVSMNLHVNFQ